MRFRTAGFLASFFALSAGCSTSSGEATESGEDDYSRRGKIQLLVTVDWEGDDLLDENLRAMKSFHERFPEVRSVQFLNAAYFTKEHVDPNAKEKIASALAPGDENGLHVHGWKRLFEAAGVTFRDDPTFWGTALTPGECTSDCGHEVPISHYTADELRKVVKLSLDTLEDQGFGRAKSFRCGGWMAKENVREALAAEGIRYDQSAVPSAFLAPKLRSYPIQGWLDELWAGTSETSQPYTMPTPGGDLVEIPDNGALADYVTADQMVATFEANVAEWKKDRKKKIVVSIGYHQETAARYLPQLERALARIYEQAHVEKIPIESVTSEAIHPR